MEDEASGCGSERGDQAMLKRHVLLETEVLGRFRRRGTKEWKVRHREE